MKRYEAPYRLLLPRRTYTVCRVDGRAFHTYLRGCERPYDETFMSDMNAVSRALCREISGAVLAYVQSDEVSVLYTDLAGLDTEPWFGGVVAKQVSIAAAVATAELNVRRPGKRALFDARVFTLADPVEVANYFLWRQRDARRNSITMAAQTRFSHRELHGVSAGGMVEMLYDAGVVWGSYPDEFRRGRVTSRLNIRPLAEGEDQPRARHDWVTLAAPRFTAQPGDWLSQVIPAMPSL